MSIEAFTLSQQEKDLLTKLKRHTKVTHWNILCRWAFCLSLAESSTPPDIKIPSDGKTVIEWKTFGGEYGGVYLGLLKARLEQDGVTLGGDVTLLKMFRAHLFRGIGYLATGRYPKGISDLVALAKNSRGENPC